MIVVDHDHDGVLEHRIGLRRDVAVRQSHRLLRQVQGVHALRNHVSVDSVATPPLGWLGVDSKHAYASGSHDDGRDQAQRHHQARVAADDEATPAAGAPEVGLTLVATLGRLRR
jgi:hypothetical protein